MQKGNAGTGQRWGDPDWKQKPLLLRWLPGSEDAQRRLLPWLRGSDEPAQSDGDADKPVVELLHDQTEPEPATLTFANAKGRLVLVPQARAYYLHLAERS